MSSGSSNGLLRLSCCNVCSLRFIFLYVKINLRLYPTGTKKWGSFLFKMEAIMKKIILPK
jgi:hypothetical protein